MKSNHLLQYCIIKYLLLLVININQILIMNMMNINYLAPVELRALAAMWNVKLFHHQQRPDRLIEKGDRLLCVTSLDKPGSKLSRSWTVRGFVTLVNCLSCVSESAGLGWRKLSRWDVCCVSCQLSLQTESSVLEAHKNWTKLAKGKNSIKINSM